MRFSSSKGQFSIEYTALAVLAMLAILVMSTYVVRAINSYFKSSEDAVEESFSETLLQSDRQTISPECSCSISSISSVCGEGTCQSWQRRATYTCTPVATCGSFDFCKDDRELCCRTPGDCRGHGCGNGQRAVNLACAGEPDNWGCETDEANCRIRCGGPTFQLPPKSAWCEIDGVAMGPAPEGLTVPDMPVEYVDGEDEPCTGRLCEAKCPNPFVVKSFGATCECPINTTYNQTRNECLGECMRTLPQTPRSQRREGCEYWTAGKQNFAVTNYTVQWDVNAGAGPYYDVLAWYDCCPVPGTLPFPSHTECAPVTTSVHVANVTEVEPGYGECPEGSVISGIRIDKTNPHANFPSDPGMTIVLLCCPVSGATVNDNNCHWRMNPWYAPIQQGETYNYQVPEIRSIGACDVLYGSNYFMTGLYFWFSNTNQGEGVVRFKCCPLE